MHDVFLMVFPAAASTLGEFTSKTTYGGTGKVPAFFGHGLFILLAYAAIKLDLLSRL